MSKAEPKKRVVVCFPKTLLQEVDRLAEMKNSNRSELIRQAILSYVQEFKRRNIRETMQRGYMEMGYINLHMAAEAFLAEGEAEHKLMRLVGGV